MRTSASQRTDEASQYSKFCNEENDKAELVIRDPMNLGLPPDPEFQTTYVPGRMLCERYRQVQPDEHPEGTVIGQDSANLLTRAEKKKFGTQRTVTKTIKPSRYAHPEVVRRVGRKKVDQDKLKHCNHGPRTNQ
jgi:hypothetical protein